MSSRQELDGKIRQEILEAVMGMLAEKYDTDVLTVSTSELAIPVVDEEGNEKFALIKVSIPRGTRQNGTYITYDGYAAAEAYKEDQEAKRAKRKSPEKKE